MAKPPAGGFFLGDKLGRPQNSEAARKLASATKKFHSTASA
jgi:hypothetical protein